VKPALRHLLTIAAWAALLPAAQAHDTWLIASPADAGSGLLRLELGFGNRFPVREGGPPANSVHAAGCREAGATREQALLPRQERPEFLELRARVNDARGAACWVELKPHSVELAPELVPQYFDEIRAPAAQRELWTHQRSRGARWRESYRKFMRIELPGRGAAPAPADLATLRQAQGLGLEIVPTGGEPIRIGQPATFQVLLDGQPLAGLAVQLVSERSPLGIWRETDAQGRLRETLPFGGQWLLRATRLEPPGNDTDPWRSRFVTLVFHAS
jgi:uncharacterized GH25 family protein